MLPLNLHTVAHEMKTAQDLSRQIEPFTSRVSEFDNSAAYEVARLVHEARIREGALPAGRKIGFSNRDMWPAYRVSEPIWAYVYDTTVVRLSGPRAVCRIGKFTEARIEPEIVLHFHAVPRVDDDPTQILSCIDWIAHGIEIVQSHFRGWKFRTADAIADAALHGTLMVGEPQSVTRLGNDLEFRLKSFGVELSCDGELHEIGHGSNVLGSPLFAADHLVSVLTNQPRAEALQAGELVTTGSLTHAVPIRAGQIWSTALDGIALPGITVAFTE